MSAASAVRAWRTTVEHDEGRAGIVFARSRGRAAMVTVHAWREAYGTRDWPTALRVVRAPNLDAYASLYPHDRCFRVECVGPR